MNTQLAIAPAAAQSWGDDQGAATVYVSRASAWQRFHGCTPDFIASTCRARCCDAPSRPTGTLIAIHRSEEEAMRARGWEVADGLLVTPARVCPAKTAEGLCSLHGSGDKPLGCRVSPWAFAPGGRRTLVIRNRYRMLPCFSTQGVKRGLVGAEEWPPAWQAFGWCLDQALAAGEGERVRALIERDGPPGEGGPARYEARMPAAVFEIMVGNAATHAAAR